MSSAELRGGLQLAHRLQPLRADLRAHNVPMVVAWRRVDQWQPALQRFLECCGGAE